MRFSIGAVTLSEAGLVLLTAVLAGTAAAGDDPTGRGLFCCVDVLLPSEGDLAVKPTVLPTRSDPIEVNKIRTQVGAGGAASTGWFALPLCEEGKRKAPGEMRYHAVVLEVLADGEPVDETELVVRLAVSETGTESANELRERVKGHVITLLLDEGKIPTAPSRARLLSEHVKTLRAALDEAGYKAPPRFERMRLQGELNLTRFGPPELTHDPGLLGQLGEILMLVGFNNSNLTGFQAAAGAMPFFMGRNFLLSKPTLYGPADPARQEAIRAYWQEWVASYEKEGRVVPPILKIGDEIEFIPTEALEESPRFREIMRGAAVAVAGGDDPRALGLTSWEELEPVWVDPEAGPDAVPTENRLMAYITTGARNIATAEMYAVNTQALHEASNGTVRTTVNLLGVLYGGGYSAQAWWQATPDYFRLADAGAVDELQIQGMSSHYPPVGPLCMSIIMPVIAAQAAGRNAAVEAEMMHFACRCEPAAYPNAFMSSFIHGIKYITIYRFGLRASGWEWADSPEKMLAVARLARIAARLEPYVAGARRPGPEVAVLFAESSDLWQHHPLSASKGDLRGTCFALRMGGVPVHFVREFMAVQGELEQYRLLFAGQRNVSRAAQRAILGWVRKGGTVWLTPGALTYDEADRPCEILNEALERQIVWEADENHRDAGSEFGRWRGLGRVTWDEEGLAPIPVAFWKQTVRGAAPCVARYENREPAARRAKLGRGQVVALGFHPAFSYCARAAQARQTRQESDFIRGKPEDIGGVTRVGALHWISPNAEAHALFMHAVAEAGVDVPVSTDKPNIDVGLLSRPERAAILLANYNPCPVGRVTVSAELPRRYGKVQLLSGEAERLRWIGDNVLEVTVPLNDIQAVLLDARGDSGQSD